MQLHNKINRKELKKSILQDPRKRITLSFYQYWNLPDPHALRDEMYVALSKLGVLGRIYIAQEGVNAQVTVPEENFDSFQHFLDAHDFLKGIRLNKAIEDHPSSFFVLDLKVKNKISIKDIHINK
jgi:UPF0176 protein